MKKRIGAFVVATVMTASLAALPANAMSYTVEGAKERNFGPITSVEFEIPAADSASDYSKNAAYAPPGFGTPESYLPNRFEKLRQRPSSRQSHRHPTIRRESWELSRFPR